jgi:hypothetical protein
VNLTLTIVSQLTIVTASLPNGVVGTFYSQTLASTGGTGSTSWQLTSGNLPAGLTWTASSGLISGTPTATVSATPLTFKVTDSGSPAQTATANLTLTIVTQPTITTASLPNGAVGTLYSQTLAATGGTPSYSWQLTSGALPAGLTLNPSSGLISGTPTATASATPLTFKLTDSGSPAQTATANLTLTIAQLTVTTASLPNGVVGTPYSQTLAATGAAGTVSWQSTSGTLPAGLTLSASGLISGTPTATASATPLTFKATDSGSPAQATVNLTLTIVSQLTITTASLPNGAVGTLYSQTLAATGGTTSYSWQLTSGTLPTGLTLNASGQISGTPTATANATPLTFKVTDSGSPAQTATANLTLTIDQLTITTASLPNGVVGTPYSQTLASTGAAGTVSWQLTSGTLPGGLTLTASSGLISGTPTAAASVTPLSFKATDSGSPAQATVNLTLTIVPVLTITTTSLPNGVVGTLYSQTLAATGGTQSYSWQVTSGTLPAGLTLNPSSGLISGTPTATASATQLTFKVTDPGLPLQTATVNVTLTITPPAPTITTTALPDGVAGNGYAATMAATGGTPPYSWSTPNGWPSGLSSLVITTAGLIQGTPGSANTYSVTFKVTDSASQSASVTLQIRIARALIISTGSLPAGTIAVAYSAPVTAIGGIGPLQWSATGLPPGLTIDATGTISGTPALSSLATNTVVVTATDSSSPPQATSATYTLLITGGITGTISVSSISLGQNLQDLVTITLSAPAGSSGLPITVTSGDPTKVLLATSLGAVAQLSTTIGAGQTSVDVLVQAQAQASSGTVTLTAAASVGGVSGQGTITLTPSGFVLFAGSAPGGSFNTTQGANTGVIVSSARLDSAGNFAQVQSVRNGLTVTVPLTLSNPSVGSLTPASATFTAGASNASINFLATSTGNLNPATTTITAGVPTTGSFSLPNGNVNMLTAFVAGAGMLPCNPTVGNGLEALCNIQLTGTASGLLNITLTSNSSNLLLSNTPNGVGANQIKVTVASNHSLSSDFYVYGLANTGSATYSVNGGALGIVTGTVTLAPAGFIISGPNLGYPITTTTKASVGVGIYPVLLTSNGDVATDQNGPIYQSLAGNSSITVNTTGTPIPPAVTVGALNPPQVTISGGTSSGATVFQPAGDVGSITLAVVQPTGFTVPNQYTSVVATVHLPGMSVLTPATGVGYGLQAGVLITLGAVATAGQQIIVTSNDPTNLTLSTDPTKPGQNTITLTLNAGDQQASFNVYGLATSGNPGFTVTAPGFGSASGTVTLTPSVVVFGVTYPYFFTTLTTAVAAGSTPLTLATGQVDEYGNFTAFESVAGGSSVTIGLNNSNPATGTIDQRQVTFNGNDGLLNVTFTPIQPGSTTVSIVSVPPPFSVYPGYGSVGISVTN